LDQIKENDEVTERLKTIPGIGFTMLIGHEISINTSKWALIEAIKTKDRIVCLNNKLLWSNVG